jgi:tetratricopeptide (TPR) repeat protein
MDRNWYVFADLDLNKGPTLTYFSSSSPLSGSAAEAMEDYERAIAAYESSLRHNPYSVPAMNAIAGVHRTMDRFEKVRLPVYLTTNV